jgi:Icc-related predicted phosphoesterase
METKILFTSDLHGGNTFFLKVLSVAKSWNVDILFMSGDITGKAIVPIVKVSEDRHASTFFGQEYKLQQGEVAQFADKVGKAGYYSYVCSRDEYEALRAAPENVAKLFENLMKKRLEEWIQKCDEILPKNIKIIFNPGNDDPFLIDDVLRRSERTIYTIGKVEPLDDNHSLISCDWVNPTPWKSPRECSEEELEERLNREFDKVSSFENLVCDFHVPPWDSPLDLAPKLDSKLKPKTFFGQPVMVHVGSTAVRKAIEKYHPLLTMHGHIHESPGAFKIGRTVCINPGAEYLEGIMHGYLLKLTYGQVDYHPVIGG